MLTWRILRPTTAGCPVVGTLINPTYPEGIANQTRTVTVSCVNCCNVIATHVCCIAQPPTDPPSPTRASVYGLTEMPTIQLQTMHTPVDLTTPILIINFIVLYIWKCYSIMCELLQCDCNICMLYCTITHSIAILLRYSLRSPLQRYSVMIITCGGRRTHY